MSAIGHISVSADISEEKAKEVLELYLRYVLFQLVFVGPVETVFGRISVSANNQLVLLKQNPKLQELLESKITKEAMAERISNLVIESTHGN